MRPTVRMAPQPVHEPSVRAFIREQRHEESERMRSMRLDKVIPNKRVVFKRQRAVKAVAFSSDERRLAVGSFDKTVTIFDVTSSCKLQEFTFGDSRVTSLLWSSNDKFIVVGLHELKMAVIIRPESESERAGRDSRNEPIVHEFDPRNPEEPPFFEGTVPLGQPVRSVAWALEDAYLVLGSGNEARIVKWPPAGPPNITINPSSTRNDSIQCNDTVMAVAWSSVAVSRVKPPLADGSYDKSVARLAVGSFGKSVKIVEVALSSGSTSLELKERSRRITVSGDVFAVAWSSDNLYLAVGASNCGSATVVDVISGQTVHKIEHTKGVMSGEPVGCGNI